MEITDAPQEPANPLPLQAHPSFARSLLAMGQSARAVAVQKEGAVIANLVQIRRRILGVPLTLATRGPVWRPDIPETLRTMALNHLCLRLVEPDMADPALRPAGYRQILTPVHIAELDLTIDPVARLHSLAPNWRNALHKAEQAGLSVVSQAFDSMAHGWLLSAEAGQRSTRGYRALPLDFIRAYAQTNPGQAIVFIAIKDAAPVAAMMMLRHGLTATYHLGWSGSQGRATAAHQLVLIRAADWLAERGHIRLDLGAVDTDSNRGLARFKIGSGARIRPLGGSWVKVPGL
ncbi:MAG: GNAT family N-acetyltransferase [Rhodobacterales bacterium]|nr:GNAT family N-acetyltransferase [Rhodobacterales bacterium]